MYPARILVALIGTLTAPALAESEPPTAAEAHLKAVLTERYPDAVIEQVRASPDIDGWYEVVTSSDIAYSSASGDLLVIGKLTDTRTKEDLSARRWSQMHAIEFNSLPFGRAIKSVRGNGTRVMAVFADPDCPYCRRLEQQLKGAQDLTVYTFLFPIAELHPDAEHRSAQIWCSADAARSWAGWMLERASLPEGTCADTPIAELAALGAKLKITGTPTIFLADGSRIVGAVDASELERRLQAASVPRPAGPQNKFATIGP